jgi:hypothetical protein
VDLPSELGPLVGQAVELVVDALLVQADGAAAALRVREVRLATGGPLPGGKLKKGQPREMFAIEAWRKRGPVPGPGGADVWLAAAEPVVFAVDPPVVWHGLLQFEW